MTVQADPAVFMMDRAKDRGPQPLLSRLTAGMLSVCTLCLLAGCWGGSGNVCIPPDEPYLAARDNAPLRVPEGLTQPAKVESLTIPAAGERAGRAGAAADGRERCLVEPPSYFRAAGTLARSPEEVVASWSHAWANREADAVIALYSTSFTAPTDAADSAAWLEQRREQVATGPVPEPAIQDLKVVPDGEDRRTVSFVQRFGANTLAKELTLVRESGSWRIVAEKVVEVR